MLEAIYKFDFAILDWIQEHLRCGFLDFIMVPITHLGKWGAFFIICSVAMLFFPKWRKTGWSIAAAMLLGLIVCNFTIKPLVARPRPYSAETIERFGRSAVELIKGVEESEFSFPSGHTIAAFEFATAFAIRKPKWGPAVFILATLIAFSRLYLFVHYPTDVFASVILGSLFGLLGVVIVNAIYKLIERRKAAKASK
jgi:undecaprenyl-diphosphatase